MTPTAAPRTFIALSNELLEADIKLSLTAKRIVYLYLTKIIPLVKCQEETMVSPGDSLTIDRKFTISHIEYSKRLGISASNSWKELRNISEELFHAEIILNQENISVHFRWFSYLKLDDGNKIIEASWSEEIIPYISQLKGYYTALNFNDFVKLSSVYSQKLYEMLKCNSFFDNWWKIPIKELYGKFQVPPSRQNYGQFKGRILKPALAELKLKLLWEIEMQEFKHGKEVVELWMRKL